MSTADYPDALTRRIEQLAAASVEEPEGEGAAVAALVGALRSDIGAVRAELGSLRSETGAVRSDLDGLSGRLTGSVAASRGETGTLVRRVAELATRLEGVGGRVDDVRSGLPALSRELREGLADVPVRTGARLDALSGMLTEAVGTRVDGVAADLNRTLTAALDRDARAAAGAAVALEEARFALESRLAALEDALDVLGERLEALGRDGASTTTARLTTIETEVSSLADRLELEGRERAEQVVTRLSDVTGAGLSTLETTLYDRLSQDLQQRDEALRRDVLGALEQARDQADEDREAVAELAGSVRTALDGFGGVLERSLTGLGRSVGAALTEGAAQGRDELAETADRLAGTLGALQAEVVVRDEATTGLLAGVQSAVESRLEVVRTQLVTAMTVLRSDVATEVGVLAPRVDELVVAGTATGEGLRALRGELVATVEGLRDRLVADATQVLRSAVTETRAEVADTARALRADLLDRIEEQYGAVAERLAETAHSTDASTATVRASADRLGVLLSASAESRRAVEERLAGLDDAVTGRLAAVETTVTRRADEVQAAMTAGIGELGGRLTTGVAALGTQVEGSGRTTGEAGERVAALLVLAERHRGEVERQLQAVREDVAERGRDLSTELLGRTEAALTALAERLTVLDVTVDERQADVVERLGGLASDVDRGATSSALASAALAEVSTSQEALAETVAGFRAEWPTRTFEVVQGARAVAEGVVADVREQVGRQLEQVRAELARAADGVQDASTGLSSGTDRLSRAGGVLVDYLEQRDRLLEAERDRVLHEVLDTFASGLSARERTALSGRVGDAVARRRDARDADRYRSAVGAPVPPVLDLPDQVRELRPPPAAEASAADRGRRQAQSPAAPPAPPVPPAGHERVEAPDRRGRGGAGPGVPGRSSAGPGRVVAPRPAPARVVTPKAPGPKVVAPKVVAATPSAARAPAPTAPARKTPERKAPERTASAPEESAPKAPAPKAPTPTATTPAADTAVSAPASRPAFSDRPAAPAPAATPMTAPAAPLRTAPTAPPRATAKGERRARVDVMPEARSPQVALDAAAPTAAPPAAASPTAALPTAPTAASSAAATPEAALPGRPDGARTDSGHVGTAPTSWASRPGQAPPAPGEPDQDPGARRLFRRRKP